MTQDTNMNETSLVLAEYSREGLTLSYQILSALIVVAPNGQAQAQLTADYNQAVLDGGAPAALLWATSTLNNGVFHNDWPWAPLYPG